MCVQDLVTSYINITDGISNEAATNFQDMCKRFSTKNPKITQQIIQNVKLKLKQFNAHFYQFVHIPTECIVSSFGSINL